MVLTLTDCGPPDVLESTGALTVNAFDLVLANDDVTECGTVSERKDSVRIAALSLTSAADATAIGLEATVERASDHLGLGEGLSTLGGRDGDSSTLGETGKAFGGLVGGAGRGSSGESQDGSSDRSLHVDGSWVGSWG